MICQKLKETVNSPSSGVIRKMFEEGAILKQKYGAENVYDFSLGNPDLDPPQKVLDAINQVVSEETHLSHGYMPNPGYVETRAAMAKKTEVEQGVSVDYSNVVMAVGAAGALNVVMKTLLNPEDEVVVPCPYFAEYDHYIKNYNGNIVRVSTKADFGLDENVIKEIVNILKIQLLKNTMLTS